MALSKSINTVELVRPGINPYQGLPGGLEVSVGHLVSCCYVSIEFAKI